MTRRRDCTCAGTAPGYPQHEDWCGRPERPYEPLDWDDYANDPVPAMPRPAVELHSVPTTGGDERKPSLSDCLRANGVPRQQWATVSAAVAVWMRAWFHDVLDDEPPAQRLHNPWDASCSRNLHGEPTALGSRCPICRPATTSDEPDPDGAA